MRLSIMPIILDGILTNAKKVTDFLYFIEDREQRWIRLLQFHGVHLRIVVRPHATEDGFVKNINANSN